ncbi:MAG: helix-turn-helix domain-containing protein [Verrucomicrobiota bacterium]
MQGSADDREQYLTAYEASQELRCCLKTLSRYRKAGHLIFKKINSRRFLYLKESVRTFKKDQ